MQTSLNSIAVSRAASFETPLRLILGSAKRVSKDEAQGLLKMRVKFLSNNQPR